MSKNSSKNTYADNVDAADASHLLKFFRGASPVWFTTSRSLLEPPPLME